MPDKNQTPEKYFFRCKCGTRNTTNNKRDKTCKLCAVKPPSTLKEEEKVSSKLLPCPLCDSDKFVFLGGYYNSKWTIKCTQCDLALTDDRKDKVKANWNNRPEATSLSKVIDILEGKKYYIKPEIPKSPFEIEKIDEIIETIKKEFNL